jgi:hypothetical protein
LTDPGEALPQCREWEAIMTDAPDDASAVRQEAQPAPGLAPERGALMLAMGILSLLVPPLGIVTWLLARRDLREMREGRMDPWGRSLTAIGLALGIVGSALCVFVVLALLRFACMESRLPSPTPLWPR